MKKILKLSLMLCLCSVFLIGCGEKKVDMDAEAYSTALTEVGLAIDDVIVCTEENDKNELLGRPNQYTSKVNFENGSVEVFNNTKDAKTRKEYIDSIGAGAALFAEYSYINDNALLRIDKKLTPTEAEKYETEFMKL